MNRAFVALFIAAVPLMTGAATFYAEPYIGRYTRSGTVYTGLEMTCAVAGDRWLDLQGQTLTVCTEPRDIGTSPECIDVLVNDSGDAEAFAEHGVVVDLSVRAFRELAPLGAGRLDVTVWSSHLGAGR